MKLFVFQAVLFLVPGFLFCSLLGVRSFVFQTSLLLSYSLAMLIAALLWLTSVDAWALMIIHICITATLMLLVILKPKFHYSFGAAVRKSTTNNVRTDWFGPSAFIQVALGLLLIAVVWWVGPYSEVPADVWTHLENIKDAKHLPRKYALFEEVNIWYLLQGYVWKHSTATFEEYLVWTSYFNTLVFLFSIYTFTVTIIVNEGCKLVRARWIGILASILTFLFFGMDVFAYVRYYTFGPGYFAYIIYLLSIGLLAEIARINWLSKGAISSWLVYLICLFVVATVHKQEALFVILLTGTFLIVEVSGKFSRLITQRGYRLVERINKIGINWFAIFAIIVLGSVFVLWLGPDDRLENVQSLHRDIYHLGNWLDMFNGLYVLKPTGQFLDVFDAFSMTVILVMLLTRHFSKVPFILTCSVLTVVVTVFNPAFTRLFFFVTDQDVLWRIAYLAPIPLIGAIVIGNNVSAMLDGFRPSRRQLISALLILLVVGFNFSSASSVRWLDWRKFETLKKTGAENSYYLWLDLLDALENLDDSHDVLTDPVTGYVITGATKHHNRRWKFHKRSYIEFNHNGYSPTRSFEDYEGWLVVINQRDGAASSVGEKSGHWPEDILSVSTNYTDRFIEFIKTTNRFQLIWVGDRIEVYEIGKKIE